MGETVAKVIMRGGNKNSLYKCQPFQEDAQQDMQKQV